MFLLFIVVGSDEIYSMTKISYILPHLALMCVYAHGCIKRLTHLTVTSFSKIQNSAGPCKSYMYTLVYIRTHTDQLADQMESVSIKTEGEGDLTRLDFRTRISLAMLLDPISEGRDWR